MSVDFDLLIKMYTNQKLDLVWKKIDAFNTVNRFLHLSNSRVLLLEYYSMSDSWLGLRPHQLSSDRNLKLTI